MRFLFFLLFTQSVLAQKVVFPEELANPIQLPKIEKISCTDCKKLEFWQIDSAGKEKLWRKINYLKNGNPNIEIVRHRDSDSFDTIRFHYDKSERETLREIIDTLGNVVVKYETIYDYKIPGRTWSHPWIIMSFAIEKETTDSFQKYRQGEGNYFDNFPYKYVWGIFNYEDNQLTSLHYPIQKFRQEFSYLQKGKMRKTTIYRKNTVTHIAYSYNKHEQLIETKTSISDFENRDNVKRCNLEGFYKYDKRNRLKSIQNGDTTTTFEYLEERVRPYKSLQFVYSKQLLEAKYEYNEYGKLISETKKLGSDKYSFKLFKYEKKRLIKIQEFESDSAEIPKSEKGIRVVYNLR